MAGAVHRAALELDPLRHPSQHLIDAGHLAGAGTAGLTTDGTAHRYYPPCAQGLGTHSYTFTLLTDRMAALTIATPQLTVTNTR